VSNCVLNWRFGEWHFQIVRDRPFVRFSHNPYQAELRRIAPGWRWFERY